MIKFIPNFLFAAVLCTIQYLSSPLPPLIYHQEIEAGKLIALEPVPALEPLEFWAVYPRLAVSPLPAAVSRLARQVSTFEDRTPTK